MQPLEIYRQYLPPVLKQGLNGSTLVHFSRAAHVSACTIMSNDYKRKLDENNLPLLDEDDDQYQKIPEVIRNSLRKDVFKPDERLREELGEKWKNRIPVTDLIECKEWIPKS